MPTRDDLSERQLARRKTRIAGDRSGRLSRELMKLAESMLAKLELEPELHALIAKARAVKAMNARRRAERTLAGDLRRVDLDDLAARLASVRATGVVDSDRQHAAEQWRTRLLDEGLAAVAVFPAGDPDHVLPGLIAQAQRERNTGKPPGAGRVLFRHLVEALKAREAAGEAATDDEADADENDVE